MYRKTRLKLTKVKTCLDRLKIVGYFILLALCTRLNIGPTRYNTSLGLYVIYWQAVRRAKYFTYSPKRAVVSNLNYG